MELKICISVGSLLESNCKPLPLQKARTLPTGKKILQC